MSDMFAEMELAAQRDCKQAEIERLSEENTLLAEAAQCVNELRSRLAQAEALLRDCRTWTSKWPSGVQMRKEVEPLNRLIDAFLAPDSATHRDNERDGREP